MDFHPDAGQGTRKTLRMSMDVLCGCFSGHWRVNKGYFATFLWSFFTTFQTA